MYFFVVVVVVVVARIDVIRFYNMVISLSVQEWCSQLWCTSAVVQDVNYSMWAAELMGKKAVKAEYSLELFNYHSVISKIYWDKEIKAHF